MYGIRNKATDTSAPRLTAGAVPLPCNLWLPENFAIAMTYLCVGVVLSVLSTPLSVYLVEDLDAEPAMQSTISILRFLPWSFKLLYGFISDSFPILGYYRKPYLITGILLHSAAFMSYYFIQCASIPCVATSVFLGTAGLIQLDVMADTLCVQRSKFESEEQQGQLQSTCYALRFGGSLLGAVLGALLFNKRAWGWGLTYPQFSFFVGCLPLLLILPWLYALVERFRLLPVVDGSGSASYQPIVATATTANANGNDRELQLTERSPLVPQRYSASSVSRYTPSHSTSAMIGLNTTAERTSAAAETTSAADGGGDIELSPFSVSAFTSNNDSYDTIEPSPTITSTSAATITTSATTTAHATTASVLHELHEIWRTVQLRSVWQPMIFVFSFNLLQVYNVSWQSYLQLSLHFTPWMLGVMAVFASFMSFLGIIAYKQFFMHVSWRVIFLGTVLVAKFFTLLQLLLIFHINRAMHLSDYVFSLGDDVVTAYISGVRFLPVYIMYMRLCPQGSEGATYSMLTTMGNIAAICAGDVANMLAQLWDVSNEALQRGEIDGLWKLTLLTSAVGLLPLLLLSFLPRNAHDQNVQLNQPQRSVFAGGTFLIVLLASLTWAVVSAVMSIRRSTVVVTHLPHILH